MTNRCWGRTLLFLAVFAVSGGASAQEKGGDSFDGGGGVSALPSFEGVGDRSPGLSLDETKPRGLAGPFSSLEPTEEPPSQEVEEALRSEAFSASLTGLLPMRPDEIRGLLEHYDKTREAVEKPIYPYPEPELVVETISLDPGSKPSVVKLAAGHVTTISLLDVTGAPWAVQDMTWAGNFDVVQPEAGSHIIRVTPTSEFAHGNISLQLVELKTPLVLTLSTHRDVVQYRFDARIPEFGPMAKIPPIDGGITLVAGSSALNTILDGVPPEGAVKLSVSGVDGRTTAYGYQDQIFVRSPLTLLSPGWSSSVSSVDGMHVYSVGDTPVLLMSDKGRVVRARLSDESEGDSTQ